MKTKKIDTKTLAGLAVLSAVVIALQLLGSFIRFGTFSVSLVLVPLVIGAALYGWKAGAWLGFVFGLTVILSGDAALFLGWNVFGTLVTVFGKGIAAGLCVGLLYKWLSAKNTTAAVFASAALCPLVNTGIFVLCCLIFFYDDIAVFAAGSNFSGSPLAFIFVGFITVNFFFELLVNLVLSPAIIRILKAAHLIHS